MRPLKSFVHLVGGLWYRRDQGPRKVEPVRKGEIELVAEGIDVGLRRTVGGLPRWRFLVIKTGIGGREVERRS